MSFPVIREEGKELEPGTVLERVEMSDFDILTSKKAAEYDLADL